ncbi:MAG: halocyanin domain-containing protein [Haloarculaceae archaeon]
MTDGQAGVSRRGFLRAAAAGTATTAAAGTAAAAEDGGDGGGGSAPEPDYGGWLDDVGNFSSLEDMRGQDEVQIGVGTEGNGGNFAFGPPAIHVDPGTEVVWEWTGEGGSHNVVDEGGEFESDLTGEQGFTFSRTFDSDGMYKYYCQPHRAQGMKGVILVGTDYPSAGGEGQGGPQKHHQPPQPNGIQPPP